MTAISEKESISSLIALGLTDVLKVKHMLLTA